MGSGMMPLRHSIGEGVFRTPYITQRISARNITTGPRSSDGLAVLGRHDVGFDHVLVRAGDRIRIEPVERAISASNTPRPCTRSFCAPQVTSEINAVTTLASSQRPLQAGLCSRRIR